MESIIEILFWVSIFAGGLLILLLLLSILGGLEFDADIGSDVDSDGGGIGLLKGILTFVSTSSWMIKIMLLANKNPWIAIATGIAVGVVCFFILNLLFKFLLKAQSNVI